MKKLLILVLSIFILFIPIVSASSPHSQNAKQTTNITSINFYIQRFGAQMDKDGKISSQETKYFTPILYKSNLKKGNRNINYSVVYQEGIVSSDEVIKEVINKPDDEYIFTKIKNIYEPQNGKIFSNNGKIVKWDKFTKDNYEIRWYVLKFDTSDCWHIDGIIIDKETEYSIEISLPGEPGYKDPGIDNPKKPYDYTSNFAYIYGYNDSTMAADNNLLRCEVSAMIHRLVKQNNKLGEFVYNKSNKPVFDDIKGKWFRSGIEYMNYKGAFYKNDNVYPYISITRGETFKIICLGLDFTNETDLTYDDYAAILYNAGYIQGDENGNLNISDLITRAEFCTIYNKIIGREDAKLVTADGDKITAETYGFTDLDKDKWYYEIMLRATSAYDNNGYVNIKLRNQRNVLDDYQ